MNNILETGLKVVGKGMKFALVAGVIYSLADEVNKLRKENEELKMAMKDMEIENLKNNRE
jgi:hypothetical protein